jgi:PEGA domain
MKAWRAAMTVAAVLAVGSLGTAGDDNAKPRSGGGSSSVGARHHSGSGGSKSSGGGSSSSSSSPSSVNDRSSGSSTPTAAQLRHPRAGTGTGWRDHRNRSYRYYGYDPYWYGYGFSGYSWYSPYYFGGYYGGYQPYPHRYGYSSYRAGSVRVLVQPNDARVYVDGYYAGIADDFDGLFQRLHLAPGRHDISLRLDGYRTHNVKLYVPYDGTIKLHHRMARGTGEENAGVVGRPEDMARYEARDEDEGRDEYEGDDRDRRYDQRGDRGLVRLDVRPGDASVYVDGAFRGTGRELRQLRLTAGRHRIEVVRPGYRTIDREVDVREGQTMDIDIDLERS